MCRYRTTLCYNFRIQLMGFYSEHYRSMQDKFFTWNTLWNLQRCNTKLFLLCHHYLSQSTALWLPSVVPVSLTSTQFSDFNTLKKKIFSAIISFSFKVIFLLRFRRCLPHCLAEIDLYMMLIRTHAFFKSWNLCCSDVLHAGKKFQNC